MNLKFQLLIREIVKFTSSKLTITTTEIVVFSFAEHVHHYWIIFRNSSIYNFFIASVGIIRSHHEKMKQMCEQQLNVLDKVDSGYPSWKGDLLKHLSSACLNLARLVSTWWEINYNIS